MKPTQLPSGAWRAKVFIGKDENGKKQYVSITRRTKNECLRDAAEIAIHHHEITRNPCAMTLREGIEDYLKIKSHVLSPSTIRGYTTIKKNYLQPEMDMRLESITNTIAQRAVNREAAKYAPKTVSNIFGLMRVIVHHYTGRILEVTLPKRSKRRPNIFTKKQIAEFIKAVEGKPCELPALLALMLGLRRSEVLGISEEDYDRESKTLYIHQVIVMDENNNYVLKSTTKTETSTRTLTVPPYLAKKLEYAFDNKKRICPCVAQHLSVMVGEICQQAGLPKMTFHDLRRQNASVMLSLGIADKYAMERGGWSTPSVMKNIYQLTMSDERLRVDDTINQYFEGLVSTLDSTESATH